MPDESIADDEALFDIWRRLTPFEVRRIFLVLYVLAHAHFERHGAPPTPEMIERARELRDGPLGLGHLPVIRAVLAGVD